MGVAIGDYDNDGRDDIHITNFADDFNVLYRNEDGTSFEDVSFRTGIARVSIPFLGWGTSFLDYDNDGWLDLVVVNGHVYPGRGHAALEHHVRPARLAAAEPERPRLRGRGRRRGCAHDAAGLPRLGRRGHRRRRRDGRRREQHRRHADAGSERRAAGALADGRAPGDPKQKCPRDAIGSVVFVTAGGRRVRGEVASGRGQISQSDLRVHVGWARHECREARSAVGEWADGRLPDHTRRRGRHDRSGRTRGLVWWCGASRSLTRCEAGAPHSRGLPLSIRTQSNRASDPSGPAIVSATRTPRSHGGRYPPSASSPIGRHSGFVRCIGRDRESESRAA